MADISQDSGGKKKGGKPKGKKMSTRIDFTPMVDLGFLLITFFMLTTTMSKPQTMEISMPAKDVPKDNQQKVNINKAITIIMGKNDKVFYYFGTRTSAGVDPKVEVSNYTAKGLREMLLRRNLTVHNKIQELRKKKSKLKEEDYKKAISEAKKDKSSPIVMIKATDEASYKNLVDVLDEMQICSIGKYAVLDLNDLDKELIKDLNK